jgi:GT2 family glycosyltransferase
VPSVAVIIPTFNNLARLRTALERWSQVRYDNFKVIVVNDGCTDGTREMLDKSYPDVVQLMGDGNLWFAGSCNVGLRYALEHDFDYATIFNDDNYIEPDLLEQQIACAREHPDSVIGIKSYKLGTDKIIWAVGALLTKRFIGVGFTWVGRDRPDDGTSYEEAFPVDALDGSGQFYPLSIVRKIGVWDERYQMYFADVEYSHRAKHRGYGLVSNPKAIAWHDYQESELIRKRIKRYRLQLLYLLFNKKSGYNLANTFRFWFTYFPRQAPLTVLRYYGYMVKRHYVDPLILHREPIR